jgi:RNA polymerase sigma-70 factor (ECF subfamily)
VSFQRALQTGDLQGLLDVLAPDVVLVADGGGLKTAALRPITGADKVVRFLFGALGKAGGTVTAGLAPVNGSSALVARLDGEIDGVVTVQVEGGRVTRLYYVRNPDKLARIDSEISLIRR